MYINGYMPMATVIMFKLSVVDAERRLRSCRTSHYKLLNKSLQTTKIDNKKSNQCQPEKDGNGKWSKKNVCLHACDNGLQ